MKKFLLSILTIICALSFVLYFACDKDDGGESTPPLAPQTCTHEYEDEYTCHDRKCKNCEHVEAKTTEHNYVNGICGCGDVIELASTSLEYRLIGEEYEVVGIGTYTAKNVVIPSTYNNKPVTSIGDYAFEDCTSLTSIVIPNSVTSIGSSAFNDCSSLTSIVIPNSVTSIGSYAFFCCTSLTSIVIPNSVTSIGSSAFWGCSELESIVMPDSITYVGINAFYDCDALNYNVKDGVKYLGSENNDYFYLVGLVDENANAVNIDSNCKVVTTGAFNKNSSLSNIEVSEGNTSYKSEDGNLYSKDGKTLIQYAIGKTDTAFIFPTGVETIGSFAFSLCDSLTSIEISNTVTSIDEDAFQYCSSLESVTFGENSQLTSIGSYAFFWCNSLTSIEIPNSVTSIGDNAFYLCTSLTSVVIPNSVTSIDDYAFSRCDSLTSIVIPNSVTSIGERAFSWCDSLTSIEVDSNNTVYKSEDGNLYSKDGKTLIQYAIGKTDTAFLVPTGVETIGSDAFYYCRNLTSIVIPNSVTSIGEDAFNWCTSLTSIVIPNSVTSIGERAFYDCTSLTSIVIPNSVTSIGYYAFYRCFSLTIYCKITEVEKPSGWDSNWNSNRPVVWGYTGN